MTLCTPVAAVPDRSVGARAGVGIAPESRHGRGPIRRRHTPGATAGVLRNGHGSGLPQRPAARGGTQAGSPTHARRQHTRIPAGARQRRPHSRR